MIFSVYREPLLKLLRAVSQVVERKNIENPILSNVLLRVQNERLSIIATDIEIELIGYVAISDCVMRDGDATVNFRKFYDICRVLPEQACLTIETKRQWLLISSGNSKFSLSTLPSEQFPCMQQNNIFGINNSVELELTKKQFKKLIERTYFAMADQDVRYFLNGMLLEIREKNLRAVTTDGHRLALYNLELSNFSCDHEVKIIIPRKSVLAIMRAIEEDGSDILLLAITEHYIQLKSDNLTITSKLLEGKFPDYDRVIPREGDKIVEGQRNILKEAFNRASALFSEKFRGVRLRFSVDNLKILANSAEQDAAEEDLKVIYQGQEIEISFNAKYLIDFLSIIQSEMVRFTLSDSNNGALLEDVEDSNGCYVVMPMKI